MSTWDPDHVAPPRTFGVVGWLRISVVWMQLAILIYGLLIVFWLIRAVEWPFGTKASTALTNFACRNTLRILGIRLKVNGSPMREPGAVVANHSSWLDIFALNATHEINFVAKAEVRNWFGVGIIARSLRASFIERDPRKSLEQKHHFATRFRNGDRLVFFPEGTSTDGKRVLAFKPTLFAALFQDNRKALSVQPVTICYTAPSGEDPTLYGFWGGMGFKDHVFRVCAAPGGGQVELTYHPPVVVARFKDRKELAAYCEAQVRSSLNV